MDHSYEEIRAVALDLLAGSRVNEFWMVRCSVDFRTLL
jgi:hypothetical protein